MSDDIEAIRQRWQGCNWCSETVEDHTEYDEHALPDEESETYVTDVLLVDASGGPLLDLEEPDDDEIALVEQIAAAPGDMQALLTALDAEQERADRAEAALEQLRAEIDAHADHIEPALDRIEDKAAVIGRQLWRADGVATAAGIALHEVELDGQLQPHTRELLQAAVDAYEAGRTEQAAPADQSALEQLIIAARVAGARGIWLIRRATAGVLAFGFTDELVAGADLEIGDQQTIVLSQPHPLIVLIRFEEGDGGPEGVEFRQ